MEVERVSILEILQSSYLFQGLSDEQLERVVEKFAAFLYTEGQTIFSQDAASENLYFILSGKVTLARKRHGQEEAFILEENDMFGQEAIARRPSPRRMTAKAKTDVILLRLTGEDIQILKRTYPELERSFQRALRTYNLLANLDTPWKSPREVIQFVDRRHWLFLVLKLAPSVLVSLVVVLVMAYLTVVVFGGERLFVYLLAACALIGLSWISWEWIDFLMTTSWSLTGESRC